ncbi:arginine-tRNA-protein transferase [Aspergillus alliaceus]|uniref:arginyltransferase n=1 Tax=Petromyces alliaceus TaxID=209559 RepID=A0A5N6G1U8_PETAA|nr:arginine-tRNA-protein transferase [Aspergillus alliaceus]KAB8235495.1 arginine-tRNA-protein transferase [Aspergillus alliaceus]KAE8393638.1 arginine-tRNA-protein transferase [Aspergillus alliaceus]
MGSIVDAEQARNLSLFRPLGYQRNSCGYCKSDDGSASYYTSSVSVRPGHYEQLVNRGWRRSGTLYYKQNLQRSCCPHYTMRLEASAFKSRRDQRKALNRWNKFILGPEYIRRAAYLCPRTREEKKHRKCNFDLLAAVHEAEYSNVKRPVDPKTKKLLEPAHRFEVNLEGDSISQAKFELFLKYQTKVHKEDVSKWQQKDFKRFLCSGMKRSPADPKSTEKKLGSWHQCYRLDGKLIAVAVLDLMPSGVSSVYIFYDPDYEQWEFGKLSALREIALAIEVSYRYYYMGYYIHSCQKMRYKGSFRPQYILDPESNTWDPLDGELATKLDERPYVSLSHDRRLAAQDTPEPAENDATEADAEINDEEVSLFDLHMPGVLSLEEVKALDLDHWLLLVHGSFVHMIDLVGWETMPLDNPQSVKGIIAELAAALGPDLVKESAVVLFD